MAIHKKIKGVPGGIAHAVRPGYTNIDDNPAVSGLQKHCNC